MYTCVRAILRERGENSRLVNATVNTLSVRGLITQYNLVYLVLTHPAIDHEISLNLSDAQTMVFSLADDVTIDGWLTMLGDTTLPTSDMVMKVVSSKAKYNDIFVAEYKLQRVHPLAGAGSELLDEELTDLLITKSRVDYKMFYEHILVTVNGLLHICDYSTAGVKVIDGGKSVYHANVHDIGLISFLPIGRIQTIPIKPENIISRGDLPLKEGFTISLPNVDLSDKVVMLSIGGFLHYGGQNYRVTGDHGVSFDWQNIPLAHRYYDSKGLIDLSAFEEQLTKIPDHRDSLDLIEANSDAAITAYMGLSQTFVIIIDSPSIYVERHAVEQTALPGRYYVYDQPDWPLQTDMGTLPAYIATPEQGTYVLAINDSLNRRYVHDTKAPKDDQYYTSGTESVTTANYAGAYLLEIGVDTLQPPTA